MIIELTVFIGAKRRGFFEEKFHRMLPKIL